MDARRTVLIPLDDGPFSRTILPHVQRWFRPSHVTLTLLRVVAPPLGLTSSPPRPVSSGWTAPMHETARDVVWSRHPIYASQEQDSARAAAAADLDGDVRALREAGYDVAVEVVFGDPDEAIAEVAAARQVDLVAMATHSRAGLGRFVLGSVAEATLRRLAIPLFLARPTGEPGSDWRPI
jgi:nucleotide-binding universal stress UspA family protein